MNNCNPAGFVSFCIPSSAIPPFKKPQQNLSCHSEPFPALKGKLREESIQKVLRSDSLFSERVLPQALKTVSGI
jgi:hypothetical protein